MERACATTFTSATWPRDTWRPVGYALTHAGTEIFNLGTGRGYSVLEMVHTFARVNGVNVPYRIVGRRPGDVATCYANPSKAQRLLGWKGTPQSGGHVPRRLELAEE